MASPRQIAANRRNAAKSSGPRSAAGKKRAARNAHRHGLFSMLSRTAIIGEIGTLAQEIAGQTSSEVALEHARAAAEAEIELRRVRDAKRALIDRAYLLARKARLEGPMRSDRHRARILPISRSAL